MEGIPLSKSTFRASIAAAGENAAGSKRARPQPGCPVGRAISPKDWQAERAELLDGICRTIETRKQSGQSLSRAVRALARHYRGRHYKCDPARKLKLSRSTILDAYYQWKRGGEVPAAIKLHFKPGDSPLLAPPIVRFVDFCASRPHKSYRAAWSEFAARPGCFRRGGRKPRKEAKPYSYDQVRRVFTFAMFQELQTALLAREQANLQIARLRVACTAQIRRRLPDIPPPRRRNRRELDFQI